jgi:hypothetical protein
LFGNSSPLMANNHEHSSLRCARPGQNRRRRTLRPGMRPALVPCRCASTTSWREAPTVARLKTPELIRSSSTRWRSRRDESLRPRSGFAWSRPCVRRHCQPWRTPGCCGSRSKSVHRRHESGSARVVKPKSATSRAAV